VPQTKPYWSTPCVSSVGSPVSICRVTVQNKDTRKLDWPDPPLLQANPARTTIPTQNPIKKRRNRTSRHRLSSAIRYMYSQVLTLLNLVLFRNWRSQDNSRISTILIEELAASPLHAESNANYTAFLRLLEPRFLPEQLHPFC